ncbi:hypothetical protein OJF2_78010 [Aquisphaera giovannonii]|uniref:DUF4261 domain-containing protein n=1 Tax=Aquisphaera giovannonii TaxID=406548 RepID=A0A5B9WFY7_9BACT|nr:DUF4261 domain-containing protein [Aquisphaera giovannonii]QEH39189.1 hypothetical protein OJF2_78010 [Aquisphaera giovannonii]
MFDYFKKARAGSTGGRPDPGGPITGALLLEGDSFPFDGFLEQLAGARVAGRPASDVGREGGALASFRVGDESFALSLMPVPHPPGDLEGPLATSWMWPEDVSREDVRRHRSQLLVAMTGGAGDPVRRRLALTAVTALAAGQPGVMAVYWPEAALIHHPSVFVEMAGAMASPDAPPLPLWVDLRTFPNRDESIGLFTTGLPALGHKEIEIPGIDMEPGELREWLLNILHDLLERSLVLEHGQILGLPTGRKARIVHGPSMFDPSEGVIRLEP